MTVGGGHEVAGGRDDEGGATAVKESDGSPHHAVRYDEGFGGEPGTWREQGTCSDRGTADKNLILHDAGYGQE